MIASSNVGARPGSKNRRSVSVCVPIYANTGTMTPSAMMAMDIVNKETLMLCGSGVMAGTRRRRQHLTRQSCGSTLLHDYQREPGDARTSPRNPVAARHG